jgi:hypothetical protein
VLEKLMSGGQTGVDRAALDVARELGIAAAGWCPQGRRAEDGRLQDCYPLKETPAAEYAQRTEWNIRDSDGTLVLTRGRPSEGTAFTIEVATRLGKPCLVLDVAENPDASQVATWSHTHQVRVLNVAGPRESKCPGIYQHAQAFLRQLLAGLQNSQGKKLDAVGPP